MGISGIQVPYCTGRNTPSHDILQDACDEETFRKILVDNPARAYGF